MPISSPFAIRSADPRTPAPAPDLLLRQLRHQTKNALQRVIAEITRDPELQSTPQGRLLSASLTGRICRAAEVSDQLFAPAPALAPAPMRERLRSLGEGTIEVLASAGQRLELHVEVEGDCPDVLRVAVVRVAHEMVADAIKRGMALLRERRIEICLATTPDGATAIMVRDNGWGLLEHGLGGQGCGLVRELSAPHRGRFVLRRRNDWTEAVVTFPGRPRTGANAILALSVLAFAGLAMAGIAATELARQRWSEPPAVSTCIGSSILLSGISCDAEAK